MNHKHPKLHRKILSCFVVFLLAILLTGGTAFAKDDAANTASENGTSSVTEDRQSELTSEKAQIENDKEADTTSQEIATETETASDSVSMEQNVAITATDTESTVSENTVVSDQGADTPVQNGWVEEPGGTRYYENGVAKTGWVVDSGYQDYGLQRYFLDADGYLVKNSLISEAEAGYWAYARPEGYVVRGCYDTGAGKVYIADNDGRLPSTTGWLVTDQYSGNGLQRYYIDETTHAALTSYFTVGENEYFGQGGMGYVFRGIGILNGNKICANNDGQLLKQGWLVTDAFGQGLQRYFFSDYKIPEEGAYPVEGNVYTYVTADGYVLRGTYDNGHGEVFLANNDGQLPTTTGWLVTGAYTNGNLQRYYIKENHAAQTSFFEVDGASYYGQGGIGSVLRGKMRYGDGILLADNDGVLASGEGWLVTDAYDGHLERYWIDAVCNGHMGARTGLFTVDENTYYGRDKEGYVVRNDYICVDSQWYCGDNDGILQPCDPPVKQQMIAAAQGYSSPTDYLILVDTNTHNVGIFTGSQGNWSIIRYWVCTSGAPSTPTVQGVFSVGSRGYSFGSGYTCYYWTQFCGDYLFHSVLYKQGTFEILDGRLGIAASEGCIRLEIENANWIYQTIPSGTTVVVY